MKKLAYAAAIVLTFFLSSSAFAGYTIKLKNGRSMEVRNYWEEKGEVKFEYQEGVVAIPKRNIVSIRKVEEKFSERGKKQEEQSLAPREAPEETRKASAPEVGKLNPVEVSKAIGIQAKDKKEVDIKSCKKEKAYYMDQFEQAYQRYLDATSRKDGAAKKQAWEEFNRLGGKVISMEDELKNKNNGIVPQWWKE